LSRDVIEKLFKDLSAYGVETAYLTGGDPLLYPYLEDIFLKFKGKVKIGMVTAAAIPIDLSYWEFIYDNVEWCRITLDSLDKIVYNKVKGIDALDIVLDNIDKISSLRLPRGKVRINYLKIPAINDGEETFVKDFSEKAGLDFASFNAHTFEDLRYDPSDIRPKYCATTQIHCMIDSDGEVFPCSDVARENDYYKKRNNELSFGNVNDRFLMDLWYSEKAREIKRKTYTACFKECKWCSPRANESNKVYSDFIDNDRGIFV